MNEPCISSKIKCSAIFGFNAHHCRALKRRQSKHLSNGTSLAQELFSIKKPYQNRVAQFSVDKTSFKSLLSNERKSDRKSLTKNEKDNFKEGLCRTLKRSNSQLSKLIQNKDSGRASLGRFFSSVFNSKTKYDWPNNQKSNLFSCIKTKSLHSDNKNSHSISVMKTKALAEQTSFSKKIFSRHRHSLSHPIFEIPHAVNVLSQQRQFKAKLMSEARDKHLAKYLCGDFENRRPSNGSKISQTSFHSLGDHTKPFSLKEKCNVSRKRLRAPLSTQIKKSMNSVSVQLNSLLKLSVPKKESSAQKYFLDHRSMPSDQQTFTNFLKEIARKDLVNSWREKPGLPTPKFSSRFTQDFKAFLFEECLQMAKSHLIVDEFFEILNDHGVDRQTVTDRWLSEKVLKWRPKTLENAAELLRPTTFKKSR